MPILALALGAFLATVGAVTSGPLVWADGEGEGAESAGPGLQGEELPANSESLSGLFFETLTAETANEEEGANTAPGSTGMSAVVGQYLQENPVMPWARPFLRGWASTHSQDIVAEKMAQATEAVALPTLGQLLGEAMGQIQSEEGGPVLAGANSVLAGGVEEGARNQARKFHVRRIESGDDGTNLIQRTTSEGPVGVFSKSGSEGEGEPAVIYEAIFPFRLREVLSGEGEREGEGEVCSQVVATGYHRFRIRNSETEPYEAIVYLEHTLSNVGSLAFYDLFGNIVLSIPCGASPCIYTLTETERTDLFSSATAKLHATGATPPAGILAEGARWWLANMVHCEVEMEDTGVNPAAEITWGLNFDPVNLDLALGGWSGSSFFEPTASHIHGMGDDITVDFGDTWGGLLLSLLFA